MADDKPQPPDRTGGPRGQVPRGRNTGRATPIGSIVPVNRTTPVGRVAVPEAHRYATTPGATRPGATTPGATAPVVTAPDHGVPGTPGTKPVAAGTRPGTTGTAAATSDGTVAADRQAVSPAATGAPAEAAGGAGATRRTIRTGVPSQPAQPSTPGVTGPGRQSTPGPTGQRQSTPGVTMSGQQPVPGPAGPGQQSTPGPTGQSEKGPELTLRPMVYVEDMAESVAFYERLGAEIVHGGPDSDWVLLQLGIAQITLVSGHRPTRGADRVELTFTTVMGLTELEQHLRRGGIRIADMRTHRDFGPQLAIESPDGLLIRITPVEPYTAA